MITFFYYLVISLFILLSTVLCFVILIQEGKSNGLGASFGGDAGDSIFGTSTADVLKTFTGWMVAIFLISCVFLSLWTSALNRSKTPQANPYDVEQAEIEG